MNKLKLLLAVDVLALLIVAVFYTGAAEARGVLSQLQYMENSRLATEDRRATARARQRSIDNYRSITGQDWEGRKEIRRLQKQKSSIAHRMGRSNNPNLRAQMRSIDREIAMRKGYSPAFVGR